MGRCLNRDRVARRASGAGLSGEAGAGTVRTHRPRILARVNGRSCADADFNWGGHEGLALPISDFVQS
jgi:hypothetical protein